MNDIQQETRLPDDVPSMLLSVEGKQLLLPGVSVAEIIHYSQPTPVDDAPKWFLGTIEWRTLDIPLVSFEWLNGQPDMGKPRHVIVLNNTGKHDDLPFIAMPILGIPRLVRVTSRDIIEDQDTEIGPMEQAAFKLSGDTVFVPDVGKMEQACLGVYTPSPVNLT